MEWQSSSSVFCGIDTTSILEQIAPHCGALVVLEDEGWCPERDSLSPNRVVAAADAIVCVPK
jgi:hypothetical protein